MWRALLLLTTVWAIDDGEKIKRDATQLPMARGADNPVWSPGQPIRLFALRDEVVAFQVVIEGPAEGVTVEVAPIPGIRVARFIEHFFEVRRASSTAGRAESLGWAAGSGPPAGRFTGWLPDALIPVELAPAWEPWPMRVRAGENAVVWIDLGVPRDCAPGTYRSQVTVGATTLPLELEVLPQVLPARPVATMLFYSRDALDKRIGNGAAAERQLWALFREHRLSALHTIRSVEDVRAQGDALAEDGIVMIGTYGTMGDASAEKLALLEQIADALAARGLFDKADVVLYAEDEVCKSPRGAAWRSLIASSKNVNARRVKVGWTCDDDPSLQPVDVPMVSTLSYDPVSARASGKPVWIYAGWRPASGTMFTDSEAVSLRTWGWIAAMAGIPRWFVWETTFWYDGNRAGHGPYDPFVTAETYHNADGEAAMGDGVLVYPGRQVDYFGEHSLGYDGVIPSIRLKNLRRGIEDAGYYLLARAGDRGRAEAIARRLFPRILGEAEPGKPPSWPERGKPFFDARRELVSLMREGAVDPGPSAGIGARVHHFKLRRRHLVALGALVLLLLAALVRRARSRAG